MLHPGLAIGTLPSTRISEAEQQLQEENTQLLQEVQQLQQLLSVWQQQPCPVCQNTQGAGSKSKAVAGTAAVATAHAAVVDRILRQQQVLIAQQQRQLLVLQAELTCREQAMLEADAVLAETGRRVSALAEWASQQQQQQPPQAQSLLQQHTAATQRLSTATSSSSSRSIPSNCVRAGARMAAAAGATAGVCAGPTGSTAQQVLECSRSLLVFCQEADARLARAKAAAAAQCKASQLHSSSSISRAAGRRETDNSTGCSKQQWRSPSKGGAAASPEAGGQQEQLDLPYLPAGGNAFLQPGASLTLPAVAAGAGLKAVAAPALQQLMQQLACLSAPLAAFAVQLRSMILPAMPWLQADQLAPELLSICTQLAHQAAAAAVQLSQLCALLPATQSTLGRAAVHAGRKARAQQAAAAAEAGGWSTMGPETHKQQQQQQEHSVLLVQNPEAAAGASSAASELQAPDTLEPEDQQLLQDIASRIMHPSSGAAAQAGPHKHGHTGSSRRPAHTAAAGAGAARPAGAAVKGPPEAADAVLERLRQRPGVLCFKQGVLQGQLSFLARCSAAQAKLMTRLASDVLQALADAAEAAESATLQQRRSKALQLCSQLQRAAVLATQQQQQLAGLSGISLGSVERSSSGALGRGSSSGASASRAVLALLDSNREVLDDLPKLLAAASPGALKRAATSAVVTALSDFRAALQP